MAKTTEYVDGFGVFALPQAGCDQAAVQLFAQRVVLDRALVERERDVNALFGLDALAGVDDHPYVARMPAFARRLQPAVGGLIAEKSPAIDGYKLLREHRGAVNADSVGSIGDRFFLRKIVRQPAQPIVEPRETRPRVVEMIDRDCRKQQAKPMIFFSLCRLPTCSKRTADARWFSLLTNGAIHITPAGRACFLDKLRAGDALHLAVAVQVRAAAFFMLDIRLGESARQSKLQAVSF